MKQDNAKDGQEIGGSSAEPGRGEPASHSSATSWLLAGIVASSAWDLLQRRIEKRAGKADPGVGKEERHELDGRAILTTLGLYAASRLATRSVGGLLTVAGGLAAKTLYDRGRARELRKAREATSESSKDS
ncbi:MAG: hypothetical protein AAF697_12510 [Pseudomonadota bacterium]